MNKEHTFNEAELIGSMQEALVHAQGKRTLKTTKVPHSPKAMSPTAIAKPRKP